ncbi:hypothetical protein [Bacillus vallismortis]|uniref:Uncharacterized protein n=1 Tax=Bacillus vallismortis TaxID=72361 RepID=A0AAP3FS72_BACVA|nr:hypothetical protein [Bacillus vallismortis]MCY7917264.1 hypothetical protein [Bacillus vallismortis]MCY8318218.1 hypothetical protein [Bacillus vallismortis]MCY8534162.1 hypothetical protein [Bacillus vallismortis]
MASVKQELESIFSPSLNDGYVIDTFSSNLIYIKRIEDKFIILSFTTSNFQKETIYIDYTYGYSVNPNIYFSKTERFTTLLDKRDILEKMNIYLYEDPTLSALRKIPTDILSLLLKKAEQNMLKMDVPLTSDVQDYLDNLDRMVDFYLSIKDFEQLKKEVPKSNFKKRHGLSEIGLAVWRFMVLNPQEFPNDYINKNLITRYAKDIYYQKLKKNLFK